MPEAECIHIHTSVLAVCSKPDPCVHDRPLTALAGHTMLHSRSKQAACCGEPARALLTGAWCALVREVRRGSEEGKLAPGRCAPSFVGPIVALGALHPTQRSPTHMQGDCWASAGLSGPAGAG